MVWLLWDGLGWIDDAQYIVKALCFQVLGDILLVATAFWSRKMNYLSVFIFGPPDEAPFLE